MSQFDKFRYDGKRVLVVGGASGMGAGTAEIVRDAGAETIVWDYAEVKLDGVQSEHVNLAEKDSIDKAFATLSGPIHAVFSCAGVADGTPGIERINFIGHRYLIDKIVGAGLMPRGSAIGMISSAAGLGWESSLERHDLNEFLDITDFDAASKWAQDRNRADYMWSKRAMCAYVAREAYAFLKHGIRINAICPGPTDTPLAQANAEMWLGFGADYREELGINAATPLEQGFPLVFLCSDAASGIAGITMITDAGYLSSGLAKSYEGAAPVAEFIFGRNADMEKMLAGEQ
jgi:NAD(P)-dependent dehydrogenase (short-subunit alcohol dehydrogenase family)